MNLAPVDHRHRLQVGMESEHATLGLPRTTVVHLPEEFTLVVSLWSSPHCSSLCKPQNPVLLRHDAEAFSIAQQRTAIDSLSARRRANFDGSYLLMATAHFQERYSSWTGGMTGASCGTASWPEVIRAREMAVGLLSAVSRSVKLWQATADAPNSCEAEK